MFPKSGNGHICLRENVSVNANRALSKFVNIKKKKKKSLWISVTAGILLYFPSKLKIYLSALCVSVSHFIFYQTSVSLIKSYLSLSDNLAIQLLFQTLALLNQFKSKLTQAIAETPENDVSEAEVEDDEGW